MAFLKDEGIGTGIHYPIPLHMQKAYDSLGYAPGDFPVCERVSSEIVSLPMFPQLTTEQQKRVAVALQHYVEKSSSTKCGAAEKNRAVAERR